MMAGRTAKVAGGSNPRSVTGGVERQSSSRADTPQGRKTVAIANMLRENGAPLGTKPRIGSFERVA